MAVTRRRMRVSYWRSTRRRRIRSRRVYTGVSVPPAAVRLFSRSRCCPARSLACLDGGARRADLAGWASGALVVRVPRRRPRLVYARQPADRRRIALGFRYPAAWSFVLLTKVTPGVGLLWFAVRREWRQLGIALGVTAVVVVASLVVDGPMWGQWLDAVRRDSAANLGDLLAIPLWLRLPIAAAVVIWGARTDRAWTVPVAATVAMPVLWIATFSVSRRSSRSTGRSCDRRPARASALEARQHVAQRGLERNLRLPGDERSQQRGVGHAVAHVRRRRWTGSTCHLGSTPTISHSVRRISSIETDRPVPTFTMVAGAPGGSSTMRSNRSR